MNREGQIMLARAICEKERTKREYNALKRRYNLLNRRVCAAEAETDSASRESTPDRGSFTGVPHTLSEKHGRQVSFTASLLKIGLSPPNLRRFSLHVLMVALSIYLMSGNAYEYLRNFLPLPSVQTLKNRMSGVMTFEANILQNLSAIQSVCDEVRDRFELGNDVVRGILAVDAISFQRELIITNSGVVQGSLSNETVSSDLLDALHSSFSELEKFWAENHKALISDAFVYQFQPINATIKSFVVHISPSSQGKATERAIEILDEVRNELSKGKFETVGYAMDGDSTYLKLHRTFYSEYSSMIRENATFTDFSDISNTLVVSDPLHILKRARYRLLGSDVHLGIMNNTIIVDVGVLRELLPLPSKVFSNQIFTKMHDDLAVSLFSLSSLYELCQNKSDYVAYFLPFCLMNAAISEKDLSLEERINFLEVSWYYMAAYLEELSSSPANLPDRKRPSSRSVRLFSSNIALEHCNTVASLLALIQGCNGTVNLNRIGTNPLEHTFGSIRMRSRYKNTYNSMMRSLGTSETWKRLVADLGVGSSISGRKTYYGQSIALDGVKGRGNALPFDARDIAIAYHIMFSLPISTKELESWNMNYVAAHASQIVQSTNHAIASIYRRLSPSPKNIRLNSRSILVSGGTNTCMIKREHELDTQ